MRLVTRLDRHITSEVTVPSVLAFFVYTMLMLMNGLFSLMEQVVVYGVSLENALRIVLIGIPNVAIITIPVSFLFGVLLAAGRLTADNEIIAMQSAGISVARLYKPILIIGLGLTLFNAYLSEAVIPRSNRQVQELKRTMFSAGNAIGRIQPRVFYDELPNLLLFIQDIDQSTGHWMNVLIHRTVSPDEEQLTFASRGRLVSATGDSKDALLVGADGEENVSLNSSDEPQESWILLEDMVTHTINRKHPEKFLTSTVQTHLFRPRPDDPLQGQTTYRLSLRERSRQDLLKVLREGVLDGEEDVSDSPKDRERRERQRREAALELHHRFAIPAACTTFALLALPLGIGTRSGGRGRGFFYSILVVLVYFVLDNYAAFLVMNRGVPPWLGVWIPNIALTLAALFLARRMGRWLGERQASETWLNRLLRRLWTWRANRHSRRGGHGETRELTGSIPIGIQRRRYGSGFPILLDRYLSRRFVPPLALVLLSTTSLYIIGDLTNRIDEIAQNHASSEVVLAYYLNTIPRAIFDVLPFAILIAVITVLTVLERQQEMTALKAAGLSVYRLMVPLVLIACLAGGAMWLLGEEIVPKSNRTSWRLLDQIKGRSSTRGSFAMDRNWLLARDGQTFYTFLRFDMDQKSLIRFSMFQVDSEMRLRYQLSTPRVWYDRGGWFTDGGWYRTITGDGEEEFRKIVRKTEVGIPEAPVYFGQERHHPSEMSIQELGRFIDELRASGYQPAALTVRWHQKLTTPLSALVLTLLALPFALGRTGLRASTMHGVATATILGVGYFMLLVPLFGKLGEAEFLPPIVGAWAPVLLATLFAVNRITSIRT